jgi:hypothetical protein
MIRNICLAGLVVTLAACSSSDYRSGYRGRSVDAGGTTASGTACPKSGDPFEMFCR